MTFKFPCPHCGQHISAGTFDIHAVGVCPTCQKNFEVPHPEPRAGKAFAFAILALIVCLIPVPGFLFLLHASGENTSVGRVQLIFGVTGLFCIAGLILGHSAFRRSTGRAFPRVISVFSLIFGYMSALSIAALMIGLSTGLLIPFKPIKEPPDFKAFEATPQDAKTSSVPTLPPEPAHNTAPPAR